MKRPAAMEKLALEMSIVPHGRVDVPRADVVELIAYARHLEQVWERLESDEALIAGLDTLDVHGYEHQDNEAFKAAVRAAKKVAMGEE